MRKRNLLLLFSLFMATILNAQDFEIKPNAVSEEAVDIDLGGKRVNGFFDDPITSLFIRSTKTEEASTNFDLFIDGKLCTQFKGDNNKAITCAGVTDLRSKKIEIKKGGASLLEFVFLQRPVFEVKGGTGSRAVINFDEEGNSESIFEEETKSFFISVKQPRITEMSYSVVVEGKVCGTIKGDATNVKIECTPAIDLRGKRISIRDETGDVQFMLFVFKGGDNEDDNDQKKTAPKLPSAIQEIKSKFPALAVTRYGLQVPSGNRNTVFKGTKYVHIFLDQFGNNIFSTIPQGIANRQYVVHIFYLENANEPNQVSYSVNQTAGEFQDALVFNNAGELNDFEFRNKDDKNQPIIYRWANKEFLLSTSTTNIQFEVIRTALKSETAFRQEFESQTLKTYTIKMSKVYHGSFDVGLINSTLENPAFEMVTSPSNPADKLVKKNEGNNRGVITAMATFYTSPVIILQKLFGKKEIPEYMLSGRNFLEDHKIYQRIYPAVGIGFTDKTLQNLFFGLNWEFARGGSIFAGWHYGKVNVYNSPDNFEFEKTAVTSDEFNLRRNTAWKTDFAIGLNLDIIIIRNLFRPVTAKSGEGGNE